MDLPDAWVAYVGPFDFPWGSASARRVYGVVRSIVGTGRSVVVVSSRSPDRPVRCLEKLPEGEILVAGVDERPHGGRLRRGTSWLAGMGRRTSEWLNNCPTKPSHVIIYGGSLSYLLHVGRWAKVNQIPCVVDIVEWYDPAHLPGGRLGPVALGEALARRLRGRTDGAIVISEFLRRYYGARVPVCVVVPPTIVKANDGQVETVPPAQPLRLVYAGTPGRKDLLGPVIGAVGDVDPNGDRIRFDILGPTEGVARALLPAGQGMPPSVRCHGAIPQSEVARRVTEAHFSVLLRPDTRTSHAGFPTKFVESVAAGVPVIANLTSDLGRYLGDGRNGLVVQGETRAEVGTTLARALELGPDELMAMRARARDTAALFDHQRYVNELGVLLTAVASS